MPFRKLAASRHIHLLSFHLRQSLLAESEMALALTISFSSSFSLSFPLRRILFGWACDGQLATVTSGASRCLTCMRTGSSSIASALAMAATVRNPFSQNTRLWRCQRGLLKQCIRATYAVRLLMKVILASANRSALAPATSRSDKWSKAAANILVDC